MPFSTDMQPWIELSLVPEVGLQTIHKLLVAFGTPDAVLRSSRCEPERVISSRQAASLCARRPRDTIDATIAWLGQDAHHLVTLADEDYPQALLEIADPPPLFFLAGHRTLLGTVALAIVGSRNPTAQGLDNAENFARALSNAAMTIVSGLAEGVDAAAHRGGLAGQASTIAVVGTGLDRVYPARNRELAEAILERGALISEFALGTRALPGNFPRRNRIISGLARGCLVVEAAIHSGSLITARCALDQGRDVFAIPGSIHSPLAKGCHALIKQGAKLVESASDILEELGGEPTAPGFLARRQAQHCPVDERLLAHMGYDPVNVDTLCARSGLPADEVIAELLTLELTGCVLPLPGGLYQRRP